MIDLTIACRPYDRIAALISGAVRVEGCRTTILPLTAEEIFGRAYDRAEFDVTELSMSSHIVLTEKNESAYVGLPIFISRMFRHSAIYVRTDRDLTTPEDLRGKTVGVPEYQMTAALWTRGMLSDVYGVRAQDIHWRTGGQQKPGRKEKFGLTYGPPLDVRPIGDDQTLDDMLARGELDAIISARAPACYRDKTAPVRRLFENFVEEEKAYVKKTRLFPIMHLIGLRRDLYERHPWLPSSLFKAFAAAKDACYAAIEDDNALQITLPWSLQDYHETRALMGADFWPYGVGKNAEALSAMIRYSREQGLAKTIDDPRQLFVACEEHPPHA